MVDIISDNDLVKSKLHDLIELTLENGAFFHHELKIIAKNGNLQLESNLESSNDDLIIHMPESCFPIINGFELCIENNAFTFEEKNNSNSMLRTEVYSLVIDLFNISNKLEQHRLTFPWLVFKDNKEIVEYFSKGRSGSEKFYEYYMSGDIEKLTVESYLGARHLHYNYSDGSGVNATLMPILDCLNHHGSAAPYIDGHTIPEVDDGLVVRNCKPVKDSDECFVCYTKGDMLSAYLCYGFVDRSASILRSIPLRLELSEIGVIEVFAYTYTRNARRIPAGYEDIAYFFPDIKIVSTRLIEVSHLMIPPDSAPNSLRRILQFLISLMKPNLQNNKMVGLILDCESRILNDNLTYYDELNELLNSHTITSVSDNNIATLNQLINGQQDKLLAYKNIQRRN